MCVKDIDMYNVIYIDTTRRAAERLARAGAGLANT